MIQFQKDKACDFSLECTVYMWLTIISFHSGTIFGEPRRRFEPRGAHYIIY